MKYLVLLLLISSYLGCAKDENKSYPITYTLDHIEQSDESLYLVESSTGLTNLSADLGSYGANKDKLKKEVRDVIKIVFDLREVVLLSADSLRIDFFINNEEYDTTLNYKVIQDSISIDSLQGGLLVYDKSKDEFVLCNVSTFALPGPNANNPGHVYNQYDIIECTPGFSKLDYAFDLLNGFDFSELDTLGVFLTKFVYK